MADRSKQVARTLQFFYDNPVAAVSLELFLTIGLVLFLAVFAIRPTLLTMSDLLKEIEDKKELDEKLGQKVAALATAQTEYLTYESRLVVLDEAIPATPNVMESIKIIEKTAAEQRLVITSMTVSKIPDDPEISPAAATKIQNLPITVTLAGDYLGVRKFVEALKATRRVFAVDTVVFSSDEDQGVKTLRSTITLNAPYFGN